MWMYALDMFYWGFVFLPTNPRSNFILHVKVKHKILFYHSFKTHIAHFTILCPHKEIPINTNSQQQACPTIAQPPDSIHQHFIKWQHLHPTTSTPRQAATSWIPMSEIEMDRRRTTTLRRSNMQRNAGISVGGWKAKERPTERALMTSWWQAGWGYAWLLQQWRKRRL